MTKQLTIKLEAGGAVSALLDAPKNARACYVFAHGAGTSMTHPTMQANAEGLAARGIAALRYNFLYTEEGSKRPDPHRRAHAVVRAAVREAGKLTAPLIAGGRSFGGRMTSQAQALSPLTGVVGLAFIGFPLHPAGKPGVERAGHLKDVTLPMLFLQGARDALAEPELLASAVGQLGERARLHIVAHADHSFRVPAKSGRTNGEAEAEMLDALAAWIDTVT